VDWSLAGGWKGSSSGWNLDAGASLGHNAFRYDLRNTLNTSLGPDLVNPTAPGPDGILGTADDPGIPNQTAFFAGELQRDELALTANASRELDLGLPAPVNTAFGAAWRRERWAILEGEKASWIDGGHLDSGGGDAPGGSQVFAGFSPTDASDNDRTNLGAYGDFETNLTPQLLVNGAARFEDYSDFGSLVTGKFAGRFQPDKHVTFRAAASTGFRAPGLSQMHFSKVVTNYIGGSPVDVGVFPVGHPAARALGAKDLKPEKSVNLSAGIVVSPVDEITVTLDAYRIDLKDRIVLGATFDDAASLGLLAAAGYTNVGGVQYFTNGLETRTTGLDLTAQWRVPMSGRDRTLTIDAAANYGRNEILDTATLPQVLVDAGSTETGQLDEVAVVAIEKERPDWRGTLTAEYTQGAARGLVRASYYGTFSSTQPAFTDGYTESYPARTLFDVEAGWKVAGAELALGARNLLDTYPGKPQLDYNNNFGLFPWAAASPFGYNGRYLYTRLTWTLPR
jgi:iron complex outermembrane receptor protein